MILTHPIVLVDMLVFSLVLLVLSIVVLLLISPSDEVFIPVLISLIISLTLAIISIIRLKRVLRNK